MAVVLWGYLEELILYHLGAYACFDLKRGCLAADGRSRGVRTACLRIRHPVFDYLLRRDAVRGVFRAEGGVEEAVLACRRSVCSDQWNGRNCGTAGNDISVQNKLPCMFQIQNLLYISCSHTGNFAVFYDFFCLWERCSNTL